MFGYFDARRDFLRISLEADRVRAVRAQDAKKGPAMQQLLERAEPMYVVTIVGVPTRYARTINSMKAETFLKRKNKPPIAVGDMGSQPAPVSQLTPSSLVVVFGFPKTDAITVEDKEVEFVTSLGLTDIKKNPAACLARIVAVQRR